MSGILKTLANAVGAAALAMLPLAAPSLAQDWSPDGPVTIEVGFGPGGSADALARALAQALEQQSGWTVVVQNVEGGGGLSMLTGMRDAAADGQTLAFGVSIPVWINLQRRGDQLPFNLDTYDWIATVGRAPLSLLVRNDDPATDLAALIARAQSDQVTVAVNGPAQELIVRALAQASGSQLVPVPTESGSEMIQNLLGGHVDAATLGGGHAPYVANGSMRVLASMTPQPDGVAPEAPTLMDLGYPFAIDAAFYIAVPAGMDPDARAGLAAALDNALASTTVSELIQTMGMTADNLGPDGTNAMMRAGMASVGEMITAAGN